MNEFEKRLNETAKVRIKQMLENSGYEDEMRKVFKEGAKAGAKLMQELIQEAYEAILTDAGYADLLEKWKAEHECEN